MTYRTRRPGVCASASPSQGATDGPGVEADGIVTYEVQVGHDLTPARRFGGTRQEGIRVQPLEHVRVTTPLRHRPSLCLPPCSRHLLGTGPVNRCPKNRRIERTCHLFFTQFGHPGTEDSTLCTRHAEWLKTRGYLMGWPRSIADTYSSTIPTTLTSSRRAPTRVTLCSCSELSMHVQRSKYVDGLVSRGLGYPDDTPIHERYATWTLHP